MKYDTQTCINCIYYVEMAYGNNPVPAGFCRRHPPQVVMHEIDPPTISAQWPNVDRNEWCGEHRFNLSQN